jgi:hypothetical protein
MSLRGPDLSWNYENERGHFKLVRDELARITDARLVLRISELLVETYCVDRAWDYNWNHSTGRN